MEESEELSDSSSENLQLRIAESPKRKPKRRCKQSLSPSSDEMENFKRLDKTIKETIGKCKNLTSDAARKMLYKLVKNDHVLALTLLKAEEEENLEKQEQEEDSSTHSHTSDEDMDKKSENDVPITPKLTRLKAKQLNKQLPLPELSLTAPKPDDEVVKLINEELQSDEEDEEYQPEADSDGDATNTTFSDIDSQPSTPGSALVNESPQKDGEFKVPRTPLTAEEQENIARRTRSKLCLQTTSIETIESTFVPPDIDLDLYDFDMYENEDDSEWKEFLNEFMLPLTGHSEEIDDETDPEYVAEPMPFDKEELKPVRVSKKELNQLISELLEDSCTTMFDSEPSLRKGAESSTSRQMKRPPKTPPSKVKNQYHSPKTSTLKALAVAAPTTPSELNTPPHSITEAVTVNVENTPEPYAAPPVQHYYSPVQMQTPQRPGYFTPTAYNSPNTSFSSNIPSLISPSHLPPPSPLQSSPASILVINQNQLEIRPLSDGNGLFNTSSIMSQGYFNNGFYTLPQFQTVVVQVPTIDLLQNGLTFTSQTLEQKTNTPSCVEDAVDNSNLTDDSKRNLKRESKFKIFEHLNHELPPAPVKFDDKARGFTTEQRAVFEEQFRMHCQMLAQNFLQFYAHPRLWNLADAQKESLMKLKKNCPQSSKDHYSECVKLCNRWEKELEENNERNKGYMAFLHEEVELDEKSFKEHKFFKGRFHNRLMETMLQSKAIIYVSLVPKIPFRAVKYSKVDPTMSELGMIALGMEHAHDKIYQELNSLNPIRLREPKITSITSEVVRIFNSFRGHKAMLKIIDTYKSHRLMNPIKYYFKHKRAPPVQYGGPENFNWQNVQPPMNLRRGVLPKLWENYKFSYERLQIYPFTGHNGEGRGANEKLIQVPLNKEIEIDPPTPEDSKCASENLKRPQKINLNDKFQLEIIADETPRVNITFLSGEAQVLREIPASENSQLKRNPSLKNWQKSNEEKQKNLTSILKKVSCNVQSNQTKRKTVNFLLPNESNQPRNPLNFPAATKASFILINRKFKNIIENFFANFSKIFSIKNGIPPLIRITFIRTRSFDVYWKLVYRSIMLSKKNKQDGATTTTNGATATTTMAVAEIFAKPKRPMSSEEYSKKVNRKLEDYRALILQNLENSVEKDCSFALNYMERVRKTLLENGDDELFGQFTKMLTTFNPEIESVPELYYKMETLLLPNYADLLDLFLNFLLPEHAAEIGKFCEHFLLTNMTGLLEKLNFFFRKQPSSLRKIYACLSELSTEQDLTIEGVKLKILPLLKGNQLLIDWFMELFDRPSENNMATDEYETLHLKKLSNESDMVDDEYEEMHSQDFVDTSEGGGGGGAFQMCGVKYINGKIMYRCKTLLPAKISFLASEAMADEKPAGKDEEEFSSSLCIHEIRKHVQFMESKSEDASKAKKNKKSTKKFKVVDAQTLRAHAIRLNSIHAQNGEKMSDVMHLLEASARTNGNHESPKKSFCRSNSSKKFSTSPKKVLKSPSSSSSSDISAANFSSPSPPKALDTKPQQPSVQTVKKVRTIIISSSTHENEEEDKPLKRQKIIAEISSSDSEKLNLSGESDPQQQQQRQQILSRDEEDDDEEMVEEEELVDDDDSEEEEEEDYYAWTRDEDKLILEEIKSGLAVGRDKEELINSLAEKLEKRDRSEICERYEFLLNFVTYLTSS